MAATHLNLFRHADAGDPMAWTGNDAERPLSQKGIAQVERLAVHLAGTRFKPDLILTSPKVRAHETAEPSAKRLGVKLASTTGWPAASTRGVEALLRAHGDPLDVVLVGHDPDFSERALYRSSGRSADEEGRVRAPRAVAAARGRRGPPSVAAPARRAPEALSERLALGTDHSDAQHGQAFDG